MSADPRLETLATTLGWQPSEVTNWGTLRGILAGLDATDLTNGVVRFDYGDEQLPARIATWIARIYKDEQPSDRQVRMVLAALTALNKEQT